MFWRSPLCPTSLAALALFLALPAAQAESGFAPPGGKASAALDFRIIIPPVMRVLENSHPSELLPDATGALSGQQRLVVVSNMKRGFCVSLRLPEPQRAGWRLQQTSELRGVWLEPVQDGYRLCASQAGRYTLDLQHAFAGNGQTTAQRWSVQTDLSTL
jgi:hypothetical protein